MLSGGTQRRSPFIFHLYVGVDRTSSGGGYFPV